MCSTTKLPCEARRPLPSFEAVCQRSQAIPGLRGGEPSGLDRVELGQSVGRLEWMHYKTEELQPRLSLGGGVVEWSLLYSRGSD